MKRKEAATIEFYVFTVVVSLALIFDMVNAMRFNGLSVINTITNQIQGMHPNVQTPPFKGFSYGPPYIRVLFNYLIVYICYLFIFFYVTPAFEKKETTRANGTLIVLVLISAGFLIGVINIYFAALLAIKLIVIYFMRNRENKENHLYCEAALLTASWILLTVGLSLLEMPALLKLCIVTVFPIGIVLYIYSVYRLLPLVVTRKRSRWRYFGIMLWWSFISCIVLFVVLAVYYKFRYHTSTSIYSMYTMMLAAPPDTTYFTVGPFDEESIIVVVLVNLLVQLSVVNPFAWITYKTRNQKYAEEINSLKTELGKSDANLHSLKSQINPHFLFNALNTLYGTALQENAQRTGEGIQKLGDMMRVMLEENMQDKILLSRDLDYLKNYISLQQLRTSLSSGVSIETYIADAPTDMLITPMLLIPFVENSFKHGISLISPSHIKINLHISGHTLYFDVHNSIHLKPGNDPEKGQSGIGLDNVKQRLALLYPGRHELIIRQNDNDFFVHLTLELEIKANFEV